MEINILGCGVMGRQIAGLFIAGGFSVHIFDITNGFDPGLLEKNIGRLGKIYKTGKRGIYTYTNKIEDLNNCFTIECVIEDLEIKKKIYGDLKAKITKGYFSNTSSFSVNEIGTNVGGLHFFNPVTLNLVEFYFVSEEYSAELREAFNFLLKYGFKIIRVKDNRGYIGNYLLFHEISAAFKLMEKYNYTIDAIKGIHEKLYNKRDLFKIIDIIGVDVVACIFRSLHEEDGALYIPRIIDKALERNILGEKNGTTIYSLLYQDENRDLL